ncbi:MAG: inward rectifier potassium channel [Thermoproteota archaeon]
MSIVKKLSLNKLIINDYYYKLMKISWLKLFTLVVLVYLTLNLLFGAIYFYADIPISNAKGFLDYFFFSLQTVSTIGYGNLAPIGNMANALVTIQAIIGIIFVAILTGVIFSKFSRPKSKILFSNKAIVTSMDGKKYLCFRVGNERKNDLVDVSVKITALINHTTSEGRFMRKMVDLELKRSSTAFFALTWSIFHPLENSPVDFDNLLALNTLIIGHDGTYSQTVYARKMYYLDDILFDKTFVDVVKDAGNGLVDVDFTKFHDIN